MKTDKTENIIQDLLYEASARKYLGSKSQKSSNRIYYMMAAAASLLLAIAFIGMQFLGPKGLPQDQLFAEAHHFPSITKSRSGEMNKVDNFIKDLREERYALVLEQLEEGPLSEKDLYIKTHLLIKTGNLEKATQLLESTQWSETYNSEKLWLDFIIHGQKGSTKSKLQALAKALPSDYSLKATEIIDQIE